MKTSALDKYRYQLRFIVEFVRKDTPKSILLAGIATYLLSLCDEVTTGYAIFGAILFYHLVQLLFFQFLPKRDAEIGWGRVGFSLVWTTVGCTLYALPALVLADQGSVAYLLIAVLWVLGNIWHIAVSYSLMHLYSWTLISPQVAISALVLYRAPFAEYAPDSQAEAAILVFLFLVFAANIYEMILRSQSSRDILNTASAQAQARLRLLEFNARHDGLTGLLNRTAFDEEADRLLGSPATRDDLAVLLIDLDGFKPINDAYSHTAGDMVLVEVAERLKAFAGRRDIAARLGGDEFALILRGAGDPRLAMKLACEVQKSLVRPYQYEHRDLQIGASIGVALVDPSVSGVSELCMRADQAMYRAKSNRGDAPVVFDSRHFAPRLGIADKHMLENALKQHEIRPYYQPKVDLETGDLHGFEALARWVRPDGEISPPSHFIPMIEELGLDRAFNRHMLASVLKDVEALKGKGSDPGKVAINVSEAALATRSFASELIELLGEYPDLSSNLIFEITEDVVIARASDIILDSVTRLAATGADISLDDFGTGFASFRHLQQLPFDEMKIDLSFVAELGRSRAADVIVEGFVSIANGLGARVVAEGVETIEQIQHLRRIECHIGQGYFFGRPVAVECVPEQIARIRKASFFTDAA